MKTKTNCFSHVRHQPSLVTGTFLCLFLGYQAYSDVLFEDTFDRGLTGWTAIQPEGSIAGGGPMSWYYDANRGGFSEGSNIYYDAAGFSATATAVMLINDTQVIDEFIFTARMNAGDDDGFGLIFGYQDTTNFYRVMFGVQDRFDPDNGFGFPGTGWRVERKHPGGPPQAGNTDVLFGNGSEDFTPDDQTFLVTRGQPFIVTISVSSENKLTLTILDNPDDPENSVEYLLVDNQDLPSLAGGQVGLTSWGMSGGNPSGFLVSDLSLDDFNDPLVNTEPDILGDWTVVTTVSGRTDGSNALNIQPNWGIPVGADNQSHSALVESSNALGGNDGPGQVDFTAGTIVAGVSSWKDYIMTTRITPRDDDGFGIILRYRDPANFYRIAFRGQPSGTGVQQGISVQKVVNGVYEQIFHDASQYIAADPPDNLALDVIATIEGNTLDIRVIEDVNGAENVFNYGPIEITGGTVDSGKIGFFSWAMGGVDFHSVRVDSLSSGVPLLEDNFERTLAGWTSVQPDGAILDGPTRWYYDEIRKGFAENSNIYYDAATHSSTATTVMLINDTVAPNEFTYKARLVTGDNDGFGFIFGYQDDQNFYRITFSIQDRKGVGYPWVDWHIDRKVDGRTEDLFGNNTPDYVQTFVPTAGRDFDATITVSTDNKLTLTVVDDPGNPDSEMSYVLVEDQELPGPAGGNVGILSWGQSSTVAGTHSFLITNLSLEPTPLVNGAPTNLGDWTLAIPVSREDGSNSLNILPNWGFPVGKDNQSFNTLVESSNALGGNDGPGLVDFVAGGLVAGVSSWTDYRMTTRMIAGDDDGFGVYLRYKDAANFYRIAFRSQDNVTTGVPAGVTVQKAVDGVYEEVFVDTGVPPDFFLWEPTTGQPFDLAASITGNELNIRIVDNPDVSPQTFVFNPIEILEPTVDSGKVGVWSWAMGGAGGGIEFDSVKVDNLAGGVSLEVSSSFGNPDPPVGINSFEEGVKISASTDELVEDPEIPNVRRILTGFTGSGSVPATGTASPITFTLGRFSSLNWQYRSEFRVVTTSSAGGSVTGEDREWVNQEDAINLEAVADPNFIFAGWSGKSISANPNLSYIATGPIILTAHFTADSDGDGLADDWEQANYGDLSANPGGDSDQDGSTNLEEFQRGTDPNFSESSVGGAQLVASNWENVQRDPRAPGKWIVKDFGDGYRGAWENSNDHIGADVTGGPSPNFPEEFGAANASFDGPRLILRDDVWNSDWDNEFVLQATLVVADNDGNSLYFRYQDEENWYRVTINGLDSPAPWRPHRGALSVQMKEDGVYTDLARDVGISTGPANDTEAFNFKQVLLTVEANGPDFVVKAIGWELTDLVDNPPAYDPLTEVIIEFSDEAHATGRAGIGAWGQGGGNAVPGIPVDEGMMYNDFTITVGGETVLSEDWSEAPLGSDLPEGWERGVDALKGNWQVSAHGTIVQNSDGSTYTTGTLVTPRADGEGPVLLAPAGESSNFLLEIGFHPFDNDGIGFVYDFLDADNYAKVVFSNQASAGAGMPQGVNISRKSNGTWSDILVEDRSFIYNTLSPDLQQVRPFGQARPFAVEFVHNNGDYRTLVWDMDDPSQTASFTWNDQLIGSGNRNGLHTWGSIEAHFLYFRTSNFPAAAVGEPSITGVNLQGDQLVLEVSIPGGQSYSVDVNPDLQPGRWTPIATDQTGSKVSINISTLGDQAFFRLRQN